MEDLDFDYWVKLYKEDPDEFRRQRDDLVRKQAERLCEDMDIRHRVIAKVYNANTRLDRIHNETERFNQLQAMFWNQFNEFNDALKDFKTIAVDLEIMQSRNKYTSLHVITEDGKVVEIQHK